MNRLAYVSGYKYQLTETYTIAIPIHGVSAQTDYITLTPTGELTIKKGYSWDGASFIAIDTKSIMRGSLVHDCLYQAIRLGLIPRHLRASADQIMQNICLEDGMMRIRAFWIKKALSIGGRGATMPSSTKRIHYAP